MLISNMTNIAFKTNLIHLVIYILHSKCIVKYILSINEMFYLQRTSQISLIY